MNTDLFGDLSQLDPIIPHPSESLWPDPEDLEPILAFDDRNSYLEWVAAWKAAYKQLSRDIRAQREAFKNAQRRPEAHAFTPCPKWKLSPRARAMLLLRHLGKRRSVELRRARAA